MIENFCKYCILQGAEIFPLNISAEDSAHLGICNPSILDDGKNVYISLRNVNYVLYDDKSKKYQTNLGEMLYTVPEADLHLRTRNYLVKYDIQKNTIIDYNLIDTSNFDIEPVWEFVGHEDIRLVRWNNKLYGTGCRRDVKDDGESRMELSEIDENTGEELSRVRIKAPGDNNSYCEKNWMPILDKPFHYVKWTNPTEVVKVDPVTGDCESLFIKEQNQNKINTNRALRGSSQLIPYKNGYIAIVHEVDLWKNELQRKDCYYYNKFVIFDNEFNIINTSDEFNFLNCNVEFTNGLMYKNNTFYIPFAIYDNVSFLLKVPEHIVMNFIDNKMFDDRNDYENIIQTDNIYKKICVDTENAENWYNLGELLYSEKQYYQAVTCYSIAMKKQATSVDNLYKYAYSLANSFSKVGHRDLTELSFWENCINIDSNRSEAFENIARYYRYRDNNHTAYMYAKLAYELNTYKPTTRFSDVNKFTTEILYYELMYYCGDTVEAYLNLVNLRNKLINGTYDDYYINRVNSILNIIANNKEKIQKVI